MIRHPSAVKNGLAAKNKNCGVPWKVGSVWAAVQRVAHARNWRCPGAKESLELQ